VKEIFNYSSHKAVWRVGKKKETLGDTSVLMSLLFVERRRLFELWRLILNGNQVPPSLAPLRNLNICAGMANWRKSPIKWATAVGHMGTTVEDFLTALICKSENESDHRSEIDQCDLHLEQLIPTAKWFYDFIRHTESQWRSSRQELFCVDVVM